MRFLAPLLIALTFSACATAPSGPAALAPTQPPAGPEAPVTGEAPSSVDSGKVGVLVMAHGGSDEWNASVTEAVAELRERTPTAVAYGMAHPRTLGAALDSLRDQGVERVAVVRMFLSGESFLEQTEWYLGMSDAPPEEFVLMNHGPHAHHAAPTRDPLPHAFRIATHDEGLLDADEAGRIVAARVEALSIARENESVLLLAHGAGDEVENDALLAKIDRFAEPLRRAGWDAVKPATLREDWPEARRIAEADIRDWMTEQTGTGRRAIVVPIRLSGFGPYAEVLEGFEYAAGGSLLPHPIVAEWVSNTADRVACAAGWGPIVAERCPGAGAVIAKDRPRQR